MNLDELCDEANRVLASRGISIADGRTASVVTPRNVRYYRTIGLLKPPTRRDRRAVYGQFHIDEIVEIKQAQHDGISLELLIEQRNKVEARRLDLPLNTFSMKSIVTEAPMLSSFLSFFAPQEDDISPRSDEVRGWSIHFGGIVLSGLGTPPSRQQIDAIRKALE